MGESSVENYTPVEVVGMIGFEPITLDLEDPCSVQLSYTPSKL